MTMISQTALAFIAEVQPAQLVALKEILARITKNPSENDVFSFSEIPTIHFGRWLVIAGNEDQHLLIFSSNFDGTSKTDHLKELYQRQASGMDKLLSHCIEYPMDGSQTDKISYLKSRFKNYEAFYVGTKGCSVQQIKDEFKLYHCIRDFLDTADFNSKPPKQIFEEIKTHVQQQESLQWALTKESGYGVFWYVQRVFKFLFLLICLLLYLLIMLLPVLLLLRRKEKTDGVNYERISLSRRTELEQKEDLYLQNQMTHVVGFKSGWFRRNLGRMSLRGINFAAEFFFNKGKLGGIPSIHFARWIIVEKKLVFFSNFDSSWMNYLGDFIDKAAVGLTAAWSCTLGFPPTKWLINAGASHAQIFKRWARNLQVPTQVWYSAYPEFSVDNINNNSKIRKGLASDLSEKEIANWLKRL